MAFKFKRLMYMGNCYCPRQKWEKTFLPLIVSFHLLITPPNPSSLHQHYMSSPPFKSEIAAHHQSHINHILAAPPPDRATPSPTKSECNTTTNVACHSQHQICVRYSSLVQPPSCVLTTVSKHHDNSAFPWFVCPHQL